jgi:hypothetical protein
VMKMDAVLEGNSDSLVWCSEAGPALGWAYELMSRSVIGRLNYSIQYGRTTWQE